MWLGEEALMVLLEDDRLVAESEQAVWESVMSLMRGALGEGVDSVV
jgi:hypothetical protein